MKVNLEIHSHVIHDRAALFHASILTHNASRLYMEWRHKGSLMAQSYVMLNLILIAESAVGPHQSEA
jgi:hypothetical protein